LTNENDFLISRVADCDFFPFVQVIYLFFQSHEEQTAPQAQGVLEVTVKSVSTTQSGYQQLKKQNTKLHSSLKIT